MLEISLQASGVELEGLDERLKEAVAAKLTELTRLAYAKVVENLSGRILQKRSGQLLGSVREEVYIGTDVMTGSVYMENAGPKAYALEKGGERSYPIFPTKASVLRFYWDKVGRVVYFHEVNHPPSREFAYLRTAAEEVEALVPEGFRSAIDTVLIGGH
jgi:hypothetical protein